MLAARLLAKINIEFGVKLSIKDLFSAPTVYAMACLIDNIEHHNHEENFDLNELIERHDIKINMYLF